MKQAFTNYVKSLHSNALFISVEESEIDDSTVYTAIVVINSAVVYNYRLFEYDCKVYWSFYDCKFNIKSERDFDVKLWS